LSFETEWDWLNIEYNNIHDWSTVVWGEKGPVTIKHNEGYESMSLPVFYGKDKAPTDNTRVESRFAKALSKEVNAGEATTSDVCERVTRVAPGSEMKHHMSVFHNSCPDSVFVYSVWMFTEDWEGVEYYKEFDAQGNMVYEAKPVQCFVAHWHPTETTCEWYVGDPKRNGVTKGGFIQAKTEEDRIRHSLITKI
jgi:hypothetical protein